MNNFTAFHILIQAPLYGTKALEYEMHEAVPCYIFKSNKLKYEMLE